MKFILLCDRGRYAALLRRAIDSKKKEEEQKKKIATV